MLTPRHRRARYALLCSVAVAAVAVAMPHRTQAAPAVLPAGGAVKSGQATLSASGPDALTINQSSKAAIIDWSSFSIGHGARVTFDNGSGATLNRVLSGGPISNIDGLLSATGSVYLINPSGVIIGKDGVVKVGGTFAASTLDVDDSAFLNGGSLTFSGTSKASVVNLGKVEALGGDVVLAAAVVRNAGSIEAPNGDVGLLAGYNITIKDLADQDGLFTVQIGGVGASVTNQGLISAATAELRANGGNVYALAGNTASVIKATQVSNQGGQIFLTAPGGAVSVAKGVTLDASGVGSGSGGHIQVDSANTSFHGTALAEGGPLGGNGGRVETSGDVLDFSGAKVDTSAVNGTTGTWLLDPYNLTVDAAGAQAIENGLASNNVVVQTTTSSATTAYGTANSSGSGDIIIAAPISWSSANTLTLDAYHSLHVNAPITVSGGGGVAIKTDDGGSGGNYDFGLTAAGFSGSLSYTGGASSGASLSINGAAYTLLYSMSDVQNINNSLGQNYALAGSLDATSVASWIPIGTNGAGTITNGSNGFTGIFTGLGHTISNLTIDLPSANYVGLFGFVGAQVVRDIGLVGGSVNGDEYVGGLAGMGGSIADAYTTGTVSSTGYFVGGLIGRTGGTITSAYATGAVSTAATDSGGLVGELIGTSSAIADAYATGAVTGGANVGGLVGYMFGGNITNAYATGAVTGGGTVGGLIGRAIGYTPFHQPTTYATISNVYAAGQVSGSTSTGGLIGQISSYVTITNAYWDTQTTSLQNGAGSGSSSGLAGLTTAQLQGLDPISGSTYFTSGSLGDGAGSTWAAGGGAFPYLQALGPAETTSNTIAGTVYSDHGATPLGGATVVEAFVTGGAAVSTATSASPTGAYSVTAPGSNGTVVLFLNSSGKVADTVVSYSGSSLTGVNLYGGYLTFANVSASTLSGALSQLSGFSLPTSYGSGDFLFTVSGGAVTPTGGLGLDGAGAFSFDRSLNLGANPLEITATGAVTQATGTSITAGALSGAASSLVLSNNTNAIASLGALSASGGGLTLATSGDLMVGGAVSGSGAVALSSGGALTIGASGSVASQASGQAVALAATGAFGNDAGASAVSAPNGSWLVYSSAPGDDAFGGLNSNNTAVWDTAAGAGVSASGNRYVFAYQPTLTVTTSNDSKTYGTDATSRIQADYTIGGVQAGVTGAFLGDTASAAYAGAPTLASTGAGTAATVAGGPYTISASLGGLSSASGYAFQFANTGKLTVSPKALTVSIVGDPSKTYDGTTSATLASSNYQVSGLVGSQAATLTQTSGSYNSAEVASATSVTASLSNGDVSGSNGFLASNYILPTSASGAGQITPKALSWSVANITFAYGMPVTLGSATLGGVLAGDQGDVSGVVGLATAGGAPVTPSAATAGTYVEQVTGLTGSAASNYVLAPSGGTTGALTINPAPSPLPFEPANGASTNAFNAPTSHGGLSVELLSDAGSDTTSNTASNAGSNASAGGVQGGVPNSGSTPSGSPLGQGSPTNAPYPANLSGWGDIRFESGPTQ